MPNDRVRSQARGASPEMACAPTREIPVRSLLFTFGRLASTSEFIRRFLPHVLPKGLVRIPITIALASGTHTRP
jgi:hypothetical protein